MSFAKENSENINSESNEKVNENTTKGKILLNNGTTNSTANNLTLKTLSISSINSSSNSTLNSDMNSEQFDFTKTGARPKIKSTISSQQSSSKQKSSKSSVASSSIKTDQMDIDDFLNDDNNRNNQFMKSNRNDDVMDQLQILDDFTEIAECPLCGKIVKKNLQKHFELEHKEYECPFCGLLYDCEPMLREHIDSVHQCDEVIGASAAPNNFDIGVFDYKLLKNDEEKNIASGVVENEKLTKAEVENNENKLFVCPICDLQIKDQTWLELHVDSHFNSNNYQDNGLDEASNIGNAGACALQRTCSVSSLTANVDENFELDQVMTLAECDLLTAHENDKSNYSEKENPCSVSSDISYSKDFQVAQMLERQEKEQLKYEQTKMEQPVSPFKNIDETNEQISKDLITAQILERQELESLKYNEWSKGNGKKYFDHDENRNKKPKYSRQYDPNMTPEEELEWLKNKYGFNELDAVTKAEMNLDRALKNKKIDYKTYNEEKQSLKAELESIYDSGKTKNVGVLQVLNGMNLSRWMEKRYLCTYCDHYGTGILDGGYGCGYRNTQMLLSSVKADPKLRDTLFNNNNLSMPSIYKLQKLIEKAWQLGFDAIGKEQYNSNLENTVKWIGASDIAALLSSLRIKVELVDIYEPKTNEPISTSLFNYVKDYFEKSKGHVYPIYLQHQGHSRTIVGIEIGKNKSMNLIIFDPGTRTTQIEDFKNDPFKFMYLFRKGPNTFKHKQYQLLIIKGIIENDVEYEKSKILTSTLINK